MNRDNVEFLRAVASGTQSRVFIGALTGPRGDAYRPSEAPTGEEALRYHSFQIGELAASGVDLIVAATLPLSRKRRLSLSCWPAPASHR